MRGKRLKVKVGTSAADPFPEFHRRFTLVAALLACWVAKVALGSLLGGLLAAGIAEAPTAVERALLVAADLVIVDAAVGAAQGVAVLGWGAWLLLRPITQ